MGMVLPWGSASHNGPVVVVRFWICCSPGLGFRSANGAGVPLMGIFGVR